MLPNASTFNAKVEQLSQDLDKAHEDLNAAHTTLEENQSRISDKPKFVDSLQDTHDAHVKSLTKFIIRHARPALSEDNGDQLTKAVWEIMRIYAIPMIIDDEISAMSESPVMSTQSNISFPVKCRPSSPSRAHHSSPNDTTVKVGRVGEDEHIAMLNQCQELGSSLSSFKELAADQQVAIQDLSIKSDEYVKQIKHHTETVRAQNEHLEYLRREIKLYKKDIKGYKEDEKTHNLVKAALERIASEKAFLEGEVEALTETLRQKETEVLSWKSESGALREELLGLNRSNSAASQSSQAGLKPAHSGFTKSIPKIWQGSFKNERNRYRTGNFAEKETSISQSGQSNNPNTNRKNLTIDTSVAGHSRSRSQSIRGSDWNSRKLPGSKSMLHIDSHEIISSDASSSLRQHESQRDPTKKTLHQSNIDDGCQSIGELRRSRSSSSTDESLAIEMKFYGIDQPEKSQSPSIKEYGHPRGLLDRRLKLHLGAENGTTCKPELIHSLTNAQETSGSDDIASPKARNILGIPERSDSLNLRKNGTEPSCLRNDPNSPRQTLHPTKSQISLKSKNSSVESGHSQSTTCKKPKQSPSFCMGTAVKMTRGDPCLTTIMDKRLPLPPEGTPPRRLLRRDTFRPPATAPMFSPPYPSEYLDLDPAKPELRLPIPDRYPSGGVLNSPLKTSIHEVYPSQGVLSVDCLQSQRQSISPNSQGSGSDKKVEIDEYDYSERSPGQRTLRRKRALGRSKTTVAAEPPTSTIEGLNHEGQNTESVRGGIVAVGYHSMDLLDFRRGSRFHDGHEYDNHRQDKHSQLAKFHPITGEQQILEPTTESTNENGTDSDNSHQRRPPLPPRSHRRLLSRVAEDTEIDENAAEDARGENPTPSSSDESASEGIAKEDDTEMLPFMHIPVRKQSRRHVTR